MKKKLLLIVTFIFCSLILFGNAPKISDNILEEKIYLGGMPAGFSLYERGARVIGVSDVLTEEGIISPSNDILFSDDIILAIDGKEINNAKDIERECNSDDVKILTVERDGKILLKEVKPVKSILGKFKLGVYLRDSINGIGTITFIKGNKFASLGHPVLSDKNKMLNIFGGELYTCYISGYVKGERGKAGELQGTVSTNNIGKIEKNTENGVYGKLNKNYDYSSLQEIEVGSGKVGNAEIYTTISGEVPQKYSISIIKVEEENSVKNFVIKINDEKIFSTTNGIVQGMSGSPIVQNGKLVGAVTHVFINDPKTGFGISINNMLNNL